jgi:acetyltransferase-like isoleucine patch superfamily enzyme
VKDLDCFRDLFEKMTGFKKNQFHPMVWILGDPEIEDDVSIGGFSEINATGAKVTICQGCDIASFVSINCADSHKKCIGFADQIERKDIYIGRCVFIGSHSFIKGGARIGHHSVIAAGTVVDGVAIPPYSLVSGNPMICMPGYYMDKLYPVDGTT